MITIPITFHIDKSIFDRSSIVNVIKEYECWECLDTSEVCKLTWDSDIHNYIETGDIQPCPECQF